jgi:hypothetical protein
MEKKKGWALVEINWEYNDEFSYRPEGEGYTTQAVYLAKDDVDAECEKLNCASVRGVDIGNYSSEGLDGVLAKNVTKEKLFAWAKENLGVEWSNGDDQYDVPDGKSHATYKALLDLLTIRFHEVIEVEIR